MCKYYCNPKRYFHFFLLSSISFSKLLSQNHPLNSSSKFCNHVNDVSFVKCFIPVPTYFLNAKLNIVIIYYSKEIKKIFSLLMFTTTVLQCLCVWSTAYCTTMLIHVCGLLLTNKTKWNVYMCKYYCNPNNNVIYFFFTSFHKNCNCLLSLKILYFLFQYFNVCTFGAIYVKMCAVHC